MIVAEKDTAAIALEEWKRGEPVTDDWYRYALKRHDQGEHVASPLLLCPACQA